MSGNERESDFEEQRVTKSIGEPDEISGAMEQNPIHAKQVQPEYELQDIMGEFEVDDLGNFIIIRAQG